MTSDVLACSVLFRSTSEQLHGTIAQLLAVGGASGSAVYDNNPDSSARRLVRQACESAGVAYLGGAGNDGTASALNAFLGRAACSGRRWMLYFDQDSTVDAAYVECLRRCLEDGRLADDVVAVGSRIAVRDAPLCSSKAPSELTPVRFVIASGTLFNVGLARAIGGFDADMFLDTVDHEFCLRSRRAGLRLLKDSGRTLRHEVGSDSRVVALLNFRVHRHPMWRRQLMWRNAVMLVRRYATHFPVECLRHVAGRSVDTILSALVYRDLRYLSSAVRGIAAGVRQLKQPTGFDRL